MSWSRRGSLLLAAAYLAAIPLFAFLYSRWPNDFYHSSVTHEPLFARDRYQLERSLERDIDRYVFGAADSIRFEDTTLSLPRHNFRLAAAGVYENWVRFKMSLALAHRSNGKLDAWFSDNCEFDLLPLDLPLPVQNPPYVSPKTSQWISSARIHRPLNTAHVDITTVLQAHDISQQGSILFAMGESTGVQLEKFALASNGSGSYVSGTYLRMLYLSAVTITTLGYGDIVPLTNRARMAIALEALVGVVLAGGFVARLFQESVLR